jgi:di/tricarboxylate transporter
MVPVAAEAAVQLGVSAFAFVHAVTFAASTAFVTPVGYQTNLFVYGSGGIGSRITSASAAPSRRCSPS